MKKSKNLKLPIIDIKNFAKLLGFTKNGQPRVFSFVGIENSKPIAVCLISIINNKAFNTVIHCAGKTLNGVPSFNAGVFVLNKSCAINMRKYFKKNLWLEKFKKDPDWEDSKELNEIAQKPEIIHHRLSTVWNIKNSPNAYFTHMWEV